MERHSNLPRSVRRKVFSVSGFNNHLSANPSFGEQIAGYSSFSLQQVLRGISDGHFNVVRYGWGDEDDHVNCHLTPPVFEQVFPYGYATEYKSMESNRDFAEPWVIRDLALEHFGSRELGEVLDDHIWNLRSGATKLLVGGQVSLDGLFQLFEEQRYRRYHDYEDSKRILREAFITDQILEDFLTKFVNSGGIQLVYGRVRPFANFVRQNEKACVDSTGVTLSADIPGRLVLALICLGQEEELAFGIT